MPLWSNSVTSWARRANPGCATGSWRPQSYESIIGVGTTLVLSTNSDLFKFLEGMTSDADSARPDAPATAEDHACALNSGRLSIDFSSEGVTVKTAPRSEVGESG
jgi:hypothetical protein